MGPAFITTTIRPSRKASFFFCRRSLARAYLHFGPICQQNRRVETNKRVAFYLVASERNKPNAIRKQTPELELGWMVKLNLRNRDHSNRCLSYGLNFPPKMGCEISSASIRCPHCYALKTFRRGKLSNSIKIKCHLIFPCFSSLLTHSICDGRISAGLPWVRVWENNAEDSFRQIDSICILCARGGMCVSSIWQRGKNLVFFNNPTSHSSRGRYAFI